MSDMRPAIVPKSDQLNADDLLSGPITIKITDVKIKPGEQPVSIFYEGDNGKPYKCCKSMARVLVAAWGADASKYTGRSLTLFCDPKVKWAGMEVGGIRISHMSDIDSQMTMALTVTRANKKPFTVRPIETANTKTAAADGGQLTSKTDSQESPAVERPQAAALITPDQVIDIENKLREAGIPKERFLKIVGVESIALLPAKDGKSRDNYRKTLNWIVAEQRTT